MSFFAFTATPKHKTLETFGHKGPDEKPVPFHLYSMRQAIDEGFILDVLNFEVPFRRHWTTPWSTATKSTETSSISCSRTRCCAPIDGNGRHDAPLGRCSRRLRGISPMPRFGKAVLWERLVCQRPWEIQ